MAEIELENICYSVDDKVIFDNISISFVKNKITTILGPSGTGKTTLLKIISGVVKPRSGNVNVLGHSLDVISESQHKNILKNIGMMFQSSALFNDLNVYDNVAFPLREHTNLSENTIKTFVLLKLHSVGLRGCQDLMPHELSGGMQRRVAFARSSALDPKIMLYDEPFTGLDPISLGVSLQLIKHYNTYFKTTSIIVSHDIEETFAISDQVYVIAHGNIIAHGTPNELRTSNNPELKQFINGEPDGPVRFHQPAKDYFKELDEDLKVS